ncbi:hypothetical protein MAR_022376 [Mya arenaria]|uniref:Uncharacterized protein n=1 Tax=Mya arenaria TaxID=6604 RepID=A0ABY7DM91_MYAAR|nr:hypothetical protein MAR_022376 [Mya arenaria]
MAINICTEIVYNMKLKMIHIYNMLIFFYRNNFDRKDCFDLMRESINKLEVEAIYKNMQVQTDMNIIDYNIHYKYRPVETGTYLVIKRNIIYNTKNET